ncbi:diaminopimelate epimerase [Roseimicrobium gellanilyticum]|uniref:Diaminopimelate epimerase n=1 Tax=Roseimicrobium gellanilyticum TaxID=748857 RepID=A0A366HQ27_9BACT|nr:diaminopimelate epimerase [Roseimicrobium gellanilyticum]RBP44631.1 diaminopimelate epimerase [Roseimicrobium gellanilyticum]
MATTLKFWKMNGAGNDFVMLDNRTQSVHIDNETIARLCDRHRGVGADGLLLVEPATDGGDFKMRYHNADGGEAEMCGNGARCFARYVNRLHEDKLGGLKFETLAGMISADYLGDQVRINMSAPHSLKLNQTLPVEGIELSVHSVNTGVPHAVVFVEDLEHTNVRGLGAGLRYHTAFAPKGTNANFVKITGPNSISIRTYERGVEDETLACGTGMVACALIAHELHGFTSPVSVLVRGGDTLQIGFQKTADGYQNVTLHGPADFVFEGTVEV